MHAGAQHHIRSKHPAIGDGHIDAEIRLMLRNPRNARTGGNGELVVADDPRRAGIVVEYRMIRTVDGESIMEDGVDEAVIDRPAHARALLRQAELDARAL